MYELFYTFIIFFLFLIIIIIIIVMRFIHEPPGNPLPRYDTNKLIDWLIDWFRYNKWDLFFFLSIELLHRIFSWFVLHQDTTAKYPQGKLCPQVKEIL